VRVRGTDVEPWKGGGGNDERTTTSSLVQPTDPPPTPPHRLTQEGRHCGHRHWAPTIARRPQIYKNIFRRTVGRRRAAVVIVYVMDLWTVSVCIQLNTMFCCYSK